MKNFERKSYKFLIKDLLSDPDRKSLLKMSFEIFTLMLYFKSFPRHYFGRYLFKKGITNIKDYYPDNILYYKFKPFLNEFEVNSIVENKLFFDFYFRQFGIPLPKIVAYNHKSVFIKENVDYQINSAIELGRFLENIFLENPSSLALIIKKTYSSFGGDQVYKITKNEISKNKELLEELYTRVVKNGFLFQEKIQQHSVLNKLNPSSVNSIRFDTFIDKSGKIENISAYLRMSINNSHVDNISSGGCQVGIWMDSGKLKKEGFSIFSSIGSKVFYQHPITGVVFNNFEIPFFEEAKNLVVRCAGLIPGLRLVGWDVAICEDGPVLIECNSDYDMSGNDLSEGGFKTNPIFKKILKELNYT